MSVHMHAVDPACSKLWEQLLLTTCNKHYQTCYKVVSTKLIQS